jgi:hypothetical protein
LKSVCYFIIAKPLRIAPLGVGYQMGDSSGDRGWWGREAKLEAKSDGEYKKLVT